MDAAVHSALEEICCAASNGLRLKSLWLKLGPILYARGLPLCSNVKRAVWENLVEVPALRFESENDVISTEDLIKLSVEECERVDVRIVAPEAMRKSFLGIYDIEASEHIMSDTQLLVLERLAVARENGIAQSELTKELRIPSNNLFYQLKKLDTQGLIVRQPTVIRKKEASSNGEIKNDSIVTTNMLYLSRYRKNLSSHQRLEITKEDRQIKDGEVETDVNSGQDTAKDDVRVKDFLPALEAICDKLEKVEGKVLVVSDIKRDLGYRGTAGHRSWRNICHRLKDAKVVEECRTMVNKKEVNCLRLLQSFSASHFEPKRGQNDNDMEQSMNLVKRGQITEQVVELPILRQVYDMIDAEGSKGLTNTEVCKKLGLCSKEYHKRTFSKMFSRFGLHLQAEGHDRGVVYRVWTPGNFNSKSSDRAPISKEIMPHEETWSSSHTEELDKNEQRSVIIEEANDTTVDLEDTCMLLSQCNDSGVELSNKVPVEEELQLVNSSAINCTQSETRPLPVATLPPRHRRLRYPCLTVGATSNQREQQILKMLEEEKFLIKPDLHRRLESLEKEKATTMDRKTLERTLNRLQQEGHCKCIHMSVPVVTNCGRTRTTDIILHPSVDTVSPDLLAQIHDKMRSFEIELRRLSNPRRKRGPPVPVLDHVQRIPNTVRIDVVQLERTEMMRANGFVPAKMVRAKLLHVYLWGRYADGLIMSSNHVENPYSSCKPLELDVAIKSMPLQLFFQVVGSAQKTEDMAEKCWSSLLLSDLCTEEYKCLMDTRAAGRLSWLIDILRRLKLIRLVSKGQAEDGTRISPHTSLTHALELKPYIEEPVSTIAPSGFLFPDPRPQVRHDFVLSTQNAVDDYWNTLEYCYAVANPRAALHAFPGSAVHEVFNARSWASAQVMTDDQRAELLEYVANDGKNKGLSFKECEKIAKDLNLTLEQVLRVHYVKRQQSFTRSQRGSDAKGQESKGKRILSSRKRKQHPDSVSSKLVKANHVEKNQFTEDCIEEPELNEIDRDASLLICNAVLSKVKPKRQRKFTWTEEADRQLVIEYARHRSALGPKFNRADWSSISNLPAPPNTCKRRMALLRTYSPFRKSVMKLCNMLGERYTKYLKKFPSNYEVSEMMVRDYAFEEDNMSSSSKWDDFDANDIKVALDDVLSYKRMAKLEAVKDTKNDQDIVEEDHPNFHFQEFEDSEGSKISGQESISRQFPIKKLKFSQEGSFASKQMHESVATANAVELFKLIFLSTSTAPEVPTLLAESLRRYSEHDLFNAFNYLRDKKIMIGGTCDNPFVLSQHFLHSISLSPFPVDTGSRATEFATWLHEKENDLIEQGIDVPSYLQCGEVFHLFALVSSGEMSITPVLPDQGVGEPEDNNRKRKSENSELHDVEMSKKFKTPFSGDSEITSRREKGFPGVKLQLQRETIPRLEVMETFKYEKNVSTDLEREILDSERTIRFDANESPWEAMANYADYLMSSCSYQVKISSFLPDSFKVLYSAIQKCGDQGLSMKDIPNVVKIQDEKVLLIMVEVLEAFGRALKVNAYDSFHIVDSLYESKYFLTSVAAKGQNNKIEEHMHLDTENSIYNTTPSESDTHINADEVHRVTILNLSEDVTDSPTKTLSKDMITDYTKGSEDFGISTDTRISRPLLPWMNGDGTVNKLVYEGFIRRVLGIVMQNPGILEDSIINQMNSLNPQSCKKLLEIMIRDNYITSRKIHQSTSANPPSILSGLFGENLRKPNLVCRVHFFANPMSANLL